MSWLKRLAVEEDGAEVTEWGLLVVVIGLGILAGGPTLKNMIDAALSAIGGKVNAGANQLNNAAL